MCSGGHGLDIPCPGKLNKELIFESLSSKEHKNVPPRRVGRQIWRESDGKKKKKSWASQDYKERANGPHMSEELLGCGEILGVGTG